MAKEDLIEFKTVVVAELLPNADVPREARQ